MKDYEKKYKEALERAKKYRLKEDLIITQDIFPELKESEDERMIKSMTRLVKAFYDVNFPTPEGFTKEDMLAWLESQGETSPVLSNSSNIGKVEQKPSWSEEDEKMFDYALNMIEWYGCVDKDKSKPVSDWLKSLKERVQPKQEWSEEDEQYLLVCKNALAKYQTTDKWDATIISQWLENKLKSLRPHSHWKPSEEQMHYLSWIANIKLGDSVVEQEVSKHLNELYTDLKKLKG